MVTAGTVGYAVGSVIGNHEAKVLDANADKIMADRAQYESKFNNSVPNTELGHYTQLSKIAEQTGH